jgi:hypothetical protein
MKALCFNVCIAVDLLLRAFHRIGISFEVEMPISS